MSEGEASTFIALQNYCLNEKKNNRQAFVYYLHNKGSCCLRSEIRNMMNTMQSDRKHDAIVSWREVMNTFNIEFPSICLRALLDGYSACGMNSQDGHYSGNFFWAHCDHIAALPRLHTRFNAWAVERSMFNVSHGRLVRNAFSDNCGYSTHRCRVDHYQHECPRDSYRHKIIRYIQTSGLPLNPVSTGGPKDVIEHQKWVNETCSLLRKKPYKEQIYWKLGNLRSYPVRQSRPSLYMQKKDNE